MGRTVTDALAVFRNEPEEEIDLDVAAFVLAAAERVIDLLPSDAFLHDRLHTRAQSLTEALEAGMAAIERSVPSGSLTERTLPLSPPGGTEHSLPHARGGAEEDRQVTDSRDR